MRTTVGQRGRLRPTYLPYSHNARRRVRDPFDGVRACHARELRAIGALGSSRAYWMKLVDASLRGHLTAAVATPTIDVAITSSPEAPNVCKYCDEPITQHCPDCTACEYYDECLNCDE